MKRIASALVLLAATTAATPPDPILTAAGIPTTSAAIRDYLRALDPGASTRRRVTALLRELGAGDATRRDRAFSELARLGAAVLPGLAALDARDPELRRRVLALEARARTLVRASLVHAVLRTIAVRRFTGLVPEMLNVLEVVPDRPVADAAREALRATATREDVPALRAALTGGGTSLVRATALFGLGRALGAGAANEIAGFLRHDDGELRFAAVRALADLGDRRCLDPLGLELRDHDARARSRAVQLLRAMSGKQFGFASGGEPVRRTAAAKRWDQWMAEAAEGASWITPVPLTRRWMERFLIVSYSEKRVFELDRNGREVWAKGGLTAPWSAQGLENGNRLVFQLNQRTILEFDDAGDVVARMTFLPGNAMSFHRLENGNTVVAGGGSNKVLEYDERGNVFWSAEVAGNPMDAKRLEDGTTLVALWSENRVVELDAGGRVTWQIAAKQPYHVSRLANGNTLVCESRGTAVAEYTRGGETVWQKTGLKNCYSAFRLPNGNTVIADSTGLREINATGGEQWIRKMTGQFFRVFPY